MRTAGCFFCCFASALFSVMYADTVKVKLNANGGTVHERNEINEGGVIIKIRSYVRTFQVGNKYGDFLTDNAGIYHYYLQNDGKTFVGWFTHPRYGKRIESDDVACKSITQLYAHWIDTHSPQLVEVSFDANGGYVCPNELTYTNAVEYGYLPVPTKPGARFDGWLSFDRLLEYYDYGSLLEALNNGYLYTMAPSGMTDLDGIINFGPFYIDEQTSVSWTGTNLVATWTVDYTTLSYPVTYNSGSYGIGVQQTATKTNDVALTLKGAIFTRTGYTQTGWATSEGGSKVYDLGALYTTNATVTLYPFWMANTYMVTLDAQGGDGGMANLVATYGNAMPSITVPTRTGYTFGGYWTGTGGTGTQYYTASGASVRTWDKTSAMTLFAHWTEASSSRTSYTVVFHSNNAGDEKEAEQDFEYGVWAQLPSASELGWARPGYDFRGWATNVADAVNGNVWKNDGEIVCDDVAAGETLEAYAVWRLKEGYLVAESQNGIIWNYRMYDGEVVLCTISTSISGAIAIPAFLGGYPVTRIGEGAFSNCSGLTSVTIPDSITSIEPLAFWGCSGLTGTLTIPDRVGDIRDSAFNGCSGLTSVTIPNSVTNIGIHSFADCSGLKSVRIGNGVTRIGYGAFRDCSNLAAVYISDIEAFCRILFVDIDANPLLYAHKLYYNGALVTNLSIPDNVGKIMPYAFSGCSGLMSVTIPNSVTSIGKLAFSQCSGLMNVTISDSVTSIGEMAFGGCSGLKEVTIPNSVTDLGESVFSRCIGLTSTTIGNGVTTIPRYAFSGCSGLARVVIQNGVTSIGYSAFLNCTGLTDVVIPDCVKSMGSSVFFNCTGLMSVTIGNSVTNIGAWAFCKCRKLASVTMLGNAPSVGNSCFDGCNADCTVYVRRDSTGWGVDIPGKWNGVKIAYFDGDEPTPVTSYTVTYTPGSYGAGVQQMVTKTNDVVLTLKGEIFTRSGYTQTGWATSDGGGKVYDLGTSYTANAAVTLYPVWTSNAYTVTFDANGGVGGMTVNRDHNSTLGTLPTVTRTGYTFVGWWTTADGGTLVSSSTIITGDVTYYAHWTEDVVAVTYGGEVNDVLFTKAQTVTGALYDAEGMFMSVVELKFGKINKKNQTVKVSASVTMLDDGNAKKVTAKAVTLELKDGTMSGRLVFKNPIGNLDFDMDEDGVFTLSGSGYEMRAAAVGKRGALSDGTHTFALEDFYLNVPGELQYDLLPDGESFTVKGKKWTFAKNASVTMVKDKKTKEYELVVDDSKGKTNLSSLKLTYTVDTGVFKGSFKVYAVEESKGGKKKLKKFTVNVIGFVVDGVGYGWATLKKPNFTWSVKVE